MQRCLGCMREFDNEYELCPYCGYIVGTEPEQKNHLQGGTVLADRYVVGKVLGCGGFGITYIAWDNRLQRPVAIKEFFSNALSTRNQGETVVSCYNEKSAKYFNDGVRKMLDEGKRLSKFHRNENIVDVYDYFEENNTAYIVMEYLEGCDLKKHLEENGRMSPEKAINIIIPVLNALSDMHRENLIHRDVSPDNIYLCDNGTVKLLDFGSARLAVQDAEKSISVMVKHGYAPKEQYASRSKQGPWTDVYAVCATLYKMITGELPIESIERETEPLKSFEHYGISGCFALEKVIAHGLEPEVQNRIKSVNELEYNLKSSLSNCELKNIKPTKSQKETIKTGEPYIVRKIMFAMLFLFCVFAAVFCAVKLFDSKKLTDIHNEEVTTSSSETETTEHSFISSPIEISRGEMIKVELMQSIISNANRVYFIDVDSDGKSEIITIKERIEMFTEGMEESYIKSVIEASVESDVYADKNNKKIVIAGNDEVFYFTVGANGFEFEKNVSSADVDLTDMIKAEDFIESGSVGETTLWKYFTESNLLYLYGDGAITQGVTGYIYDDMKYLIIDDGITSLGGFNGSEKLEEVYIGKSLKDLNSYENCPNLTAIKLSEGVESIFNVNFKSTKIKKVYIPSTVKYIMSSLGGSSIESFVVDEDNKTFSSDDGVIYTKDGKRLVKYPVAKEKELFFVPETVTDIETKAFVNCHGIDLITLSENVRYVGMNAFSGWNSSQTIKIENTESFVNDKWSAEWNSECKAGIVYKNNAELERLTTTRKSDIEYITDQYGNRVCFEETTTERSDPFDYTFGYDNEEKSTTRRFPFWNREETTTKTTTTTTTQSGINIGGVIIDENGYIVS